VLNQLRKRGWKVQGTELNDASAAFAREVLGLPVRTGELTSLHFPDAHFDVVILWHVLEHLHEPQTVLDEVARILRPGGVLLVAVPNFQSFEAKLTRNHWFHLDVPRHLIHFTPRTLQRSLAQAGLGLYRITYFAPEYDFFSFVQSALNQLGLRQNLLYDLLRGRGAHSGRAPQRRRNQVQAAASLLLSLPLGLISLPAIALVTTLRRGATMTVYARKGGAGD